MDIKKLLEGGGMASDISWKCERERKKYLLLEIERGNSAWSISCNWKDWGCLKNWREIRATFEPQVNILMVDIFNGQGS